MNRDLTYILNSKMPRKYGDMPLRMGNYERIAPTDNSDKLIKMMGGQKMFGSVMKVSHKPETIVEKNMKKQESSKKPRITEN